MVRRPSLLALCILSTACAYYNGLYNANRLASEARRAESQGRRGEARSLWLQAAAKADSVASRYPDSKYWDDALLMSGLAHSKVGECSASLTPLATAIGSSSESTLVAQARVVLGRCQLELAYFDSVAATVGPVVGHSDPRLAGEARVLRGRAAFAAGNATAALPDLANVSDSLALFDLAGAFIATGQLDRADTVLRRLMAYTFETDQWANLLMDLGRRDQARASALVGEWLATERLGSEAMARLLLEDGARWEDQGALERAQDRYGDVVRLAGESTRAEEAKFRRADIQLRELTDLGELGEVADLFETTSGRTAIRYAAALRRIDEALIPEADDLAWFQSAEIARDSLHADRLAVSIFLELVETRPHSVLSPKALLAVALLQPARSDSIRAVLVEEYPDSPYTQLVTGGGGAGFTAVEDSLRQRSNRRRGGHNDRGSSAFRLENDRGGP